MKESIGESDAVSMKNAKLIYPYESLKDKSYYLPLLLIISIVSHFPFVLKGFGELDAARIAVSVIDIIKHGSEGAFSNFYFIDVIPLYILYLKWFMKLLNYDYSYLPIVMNYTNAVLGTLTLIPAFFLIRRLFGNPAVAFYVILAYMFTPAFYQSTISGFPHLVALFFFISSLFFHLIWLDSFRGFIKYPYLILSCIALTLALLFKADFVLACGVYIGLLLIRRTKENKKITLTVLMLTISVVLLFLIRQLTIGSTGGATNSAAGFAEWRSVFYVKPTSLHFLKQQFKPVFYATGIVSFVLGTISFIYYLLKRRRDILIFVLSWAALPTLIWMLFIDGNNARHNMLSILPFIVMIILFFYEQAPRYFKILTVLLIFGNYFITPPSTSFLTPSGNLFDSQKLVKNRVAQLHSKAKEITNLDENKIVIFGYFHNPFVYYEILSSTPFYEAMKIGREDYKIKAGGKEYMVFYVDRSKPQEDINNILSRFNLENYVFVSATYDLKFLDKRGFKTKDVNIIEVAL